MHLIFQKETYLDLSYAYNSQYFDGLSLLLFDIVKKKKKNLEHIK